MLIPFTKAMKDDEDDVDEDELEGEEETDEVEDGREDFDEETVEDAMREVNETYNISVDEAKVARSSITKVCACSAPTRRNARSHPCPSLSDWRRTCITPQQTHPI